MRDGQNVHSQGIYIKPNIQQIIFKISYVDRGHKREQVKETGRKLHNKAHFNLQSSPNEVGWSS
jgi:hypothetical protein